MDAQQKTAPSKQAAAKAKMLSGSAWMTAGSVLSRVLGALYIIPWVTWMGAYSDQANALYAKGYNIYNLFLVIATAGIPSAMSKLVAHYNGINQTNISKKLYHTGMYVSMATGVIAALIMMFGASLLDGGDPNEIPVIRSLAWAVLLIPSISISRGYLQGYSWMAPSAISQLIEQLLRIIYMLGATYLVMKIQKGSWVLAVTQSTFAAFIGALGAAAVLIMARIHYRRPMEAMLENSLATPKISTIQLIVKIVYQAIPFIVIESGITIFQLIDQYTFFKMMPLVGHFTYYQMNTVYAMFSFNANKLYMIIIAVATAMATTVIPLLAHARAKNDQEGMRTQIENALELFYFIMVPASLGMVAIAPQVYTVFYRYNQAGIVILEFAAFASIAMGLYSVAAAMMQGISENRKMMKILGVGMIIKLILQFPCIWLLKGMGPLLATALAMVVMNYLILHSFNMEFGLHFEEMAKPTNQILAFSLVMFVVTKLVMFGLGYLVNPHGRYAAFFLLIVGVAIGGAIYGYLALKSRLADHLLGARAELLRERLHMN